MANYTLYFKTITPISITTGEKFSPYGDFVIDNKEVIFLNKEKIKDTLRVRPNMDELLDLYVAGVATGMDNNRSTFNLKKYLTGTLKVNLADVTLRKHPTSIEDGKILISEILKTPDFHPYIPGSSLKGACKTAYLYDWLRYKPEGQKWLENFLKNLPHDAEKDFLQKQMKKVEGDLQEQMKKYEIAFSDSSSLSSQSIVIKKVNRLNIETDNLEIPQVVEAIAPGYTFTTEFRSEKEKIPNLLEILVQFSKDANQRDIEMLKEVKMKKNNQKLLSFYETMKEKLENDEIFFKLGFGKGYFFNSIGLAMYYCNKEKLEGFLRNYVKIFNIDYFPIMRAVDSFDIVPWGWLQVATKPFPESAFSSKQKTQTTTQETTKQVSEIRPEYLKAGTKLKSGMSIDAVVVESGKPNKVKLMIAEGNEPIFELKRYGSPLDVGTILICTIEYNEKKNQILDVIFKNQKK